MILLDRLLSKISWRHKLRVIQHETKKLAIEQGQLFTFIINALPDSFNEYKQQVRQAQFYSFNQYKNLPGFKTSFTIFPPEYKKAGEHFTISGIEIFYVPKSSYVPVKILARDNLLIGVKIPYAQFRLHEFDVTKITAAGAFKTPFEFPPTNLEMFIKSLDDDIRKKINTGDMEEIEFDNKTFFSFFDLEDGNCLAVDKHQNVYSMVHDARPMNKKMNISFKEIVDQIAEGKFDAEQHLNQRYK